MSKTAYHLKLKGFIGGADFERYADELFMFDFHFGEHGNVFRNI